MIVLLIHKIFLPWPGLQWHRRNSIKSVFLDENIISWERIDQSHKSHNSPVPCPTLHHSEQKSVHLITVIWVNGTEQPSLTLERKCHHFYFKKLSKWVKCQLLGSIKMGLYITQIKSSLKTQVRSEWAITFSDNDQKSCTTYRSLEFISCIPDSFIGHTKEWIYKSSIIHKCCLLHIYMFLTT